jgi:beta-carotene 3-hydroxylase
MQAFIFLLIGFVAMEFVAWFTHKYVMHGFLWTLHKSHHQHTKGFFEWNDLFFIFFGSIATVLIILGAETFDYRFWLGCGVSLYGISYFLFHDIVIHKRFKIFKWPRGGYLRAMVKAHQAHHQSVKREGGVAFGLFVIPKKFLKKSE